MKKLIFLLCAILALSGVTVLAETDAVDATAAEDVAVETTGDETSLEESTIVVDGKVTLWESQVETEGEEAPQTVKVTLETKTPVALIPMNLEDTTRGYLAVISRDDLAPVIVSISPAHMGPHYNLNDYTEEMLQDYIHGVVDGNYDEENYTAEILKSEGGNTYVAISDESTRSISTIYDDFVMEIYQFKMDEDFNIVPLTDEDKAFALEIFQGIWTE